MAFATEGTAAPDIRLAPKIVELVRTTEPSLLFHHSSRVFCRNTGTGTRRTTFNNVVVANNGR